MSHNCECECVSISSRFVMTFCNRDNSLWEWIFAPYEAQIVSCRAHLKWPLPCEEVMALLSNCTVALLLLAFALSTCLYINNLSNHETRLVRSVYAKLNRIKPHERLVNTNPTKTQNNSVDTRGVHPESSQNTDISRDIKCTMAPESRFDCARDRLLSQGECEQRGCCYAPLPKSAGPPWCFYPSLYPGYKMGPFSPTMRGRAANLTRATPSYLPRDISTLKLEIIEETAGCLHLTVSTKTRFKKTWWMKCSSVHLSSL